MVTPLEVKIVESKPGKIELPELNIFILYNIVSVKAAKVGNGYFIAAIVDITAKFVEPPRWVIGVCTHGNVPYKPVRFTAFKPAQAVVETDGKIFDIYIEPVVVMVADGFITPLGEPCVALSTATGWVVRQHTQDMH